MSQSILWGEEGGGVQKGRFWYKLISVSSLKGAVLTTESIERAPLSLKSVNDIEGRDSFSFSMSSVRHSVADDLFHEGFETSARLLVD